MDDVSHYRQVTRNRQVKQMRSRYHMKKADVNDLYLSLEDNANITEDSEADGPKHATRTRSFDRSLVQCNRVLQTVPFQDVRAPSAESR